MTDFAAAMLVAGSLGFLALCVHVWRFRKRRRRLEEMRSAYDYTPTGVDRRRRNQWF